MAKSSSRKSLKSLFSRSEANLTDSVDKHKNEGEKKRFKFLKFKTKPKSDPAPVKPANESQQLHSAVEDGEATSDNITSDNKRSSLYGTAPRSKNKELSYSELDLRKPKRFATFSFGFKKRRKNEEGISKSVFGLHRPDIEEQEETPSDLSQLESDQTNRKFSMSQPELDTFDTFDIPSPPPVATNQSESYFTLQNQSQSSGSSIFDVHKEPQKAPIATIPEMDNLGSLEEKENIPVHYNSDPSAPKTLTEATSDVENQTVPSQPASQPSSSDHKAVAGNPTSNDLSDNDILQQSNTTEIPFTESPRVTVSHNQPEAPDIAFTQNGKLSLAGVDSKIDAAITDSIPVPHPKDSAVVTDLTSVHQEFSTSGSEKSTPETASSVTTTSAVSKDNSSPVSEYAAYGALYDSLFPKSFTSEILSSPSNPPPKVHTEIIHFNTTSKPVVVKTLNEYQTETIDINPRYPHSSLSSGSAPVDNDTIPYSEMTHPRSEVKSDRFSPIQDNVSSVPEVESSAPPISECVTSQAAGTRVTASVQRVIPFKQLVEDEASTDPVSPVSPVPEKMSASKRLEIRIEPREYFFAPSGPTEGSEGPLSPAYLSVGSDEGSGMEIYYSAEEDNAEENGGEEMYAMKERGEMSMEDGGRETEFPQREESAERWIRKRDEGEFRGLIVKVRSEVGKIGNEERKERVNSQIEVEKKVAGQRPQAQVQDIETSTFLVGSDARSQEEGVAATVWPQVREEGEEEGEKELLATPVQQVKTLMVCNFAPPSTELHGQGEGSRGNWTEELEKKDHSNGDKQLLSEVIQYQSHKGIMSSVHADSSITTEGDMLTPRLREAGDLTAVPHKIVEVSKESTKSISVTTASTDRDTPARVQVVTGTLTRRADLQSDATEVEHNRVLKGSEWVDTITQSTYRTRTVQEQVAVELSPPNADTQRPAAETQTSEKYKHPAEVQPDLNQGSLTVASGVFNLKNQLPKAEKESVGEMSSGYSSLSTKLSLNSSSLPEEDDATLKYRKVSLITEANTTEDSQDTATDTGSEYRWKNKFDGVSQYTPYTKESSSYSDSPSYRMSNSYSSTYSSSDLPEASAYKHLSAASSSLSSEDRYGSRLTDRSRIYRSYESEPAEAPKDEWRRSLVEEEEPAAPAMEREAESERIKSGWDSQQLPSSSFTSTQQSTQDTVDSFQDEDDDSFRFTGVFKATLVELVSEPAARPSTPPASPDPDSPYQIDMDSLVDTLKNMGPSLRPRNTGLRGPPPVLLSSLPPINEDTPTPIAFDMPDFSRSPTKKMEAMGNPAESIKVNYTLPADLGLKRNSPRDTRSPLELLKQNQQEQQPPGSKMLNLPLRASATNSQVMRTSFDSSPEELKSPMLNGNGFNSPSGIGSRLDNSLIFKNHRLSSIDQTMENGKAHRPLFRTGSLPDTGLSNDRISMGHKKLGEPGTEVGGSRFERLSFLLNSSSSSLSGAEDPNSRMSRPPLLGIGSPTSSNSPTRLLSPTGSIDLQRPYNTPNSPLFKFGQTQGFGAGTGALGNPILQRSFSSDGGMGGYQARQEMEPEMNLVPKYRAFPDAYLTKEKEHGKLNPRPGKLYIFDRPGMCGQRLEVRSDVIDATPWDLQETISIRVVRGGWVLYEKPNFKGEKIALDEGDLELTCPFNPPEEELQNGQIEGGEQKGEQNGDQNGESSEEKTVTKPERKFIIGSIRRAVRDYSVPEIGLFPEENAEGKKVTFRDTSEDARIFGYPIKANSIIINAGLWLVYAHPFFQGIPRVLEVGGFPNPAAWGVEQPYVGSLHPLKVGEPKVENISEPKMELFEKPYFTGKSRTINIDMRNFMTREDRQQTAFMHNVGSLKVQGGIWVGYEKEGYRGRQYLLEEGEYHDWRVWGGSDAEMRSVRVIRADLTDPMMVMFEQPEEDQEGMAEDNTFEVTDAIADVELLEYKPSTRSIQVFSGAWIAYSHVDFSGNQYILEKGFYNNCADWGSQDNRICSVQPILMAPTDSTRTSNELILYSEADFKGQCHIFNRNQEEIPEKVLTKSCRVSGGSWVLYEDKKYSGNMFVLSEGDYPNLTSMGCPPVSYIRSAKVVPMTFSVPSISLFGLECLEGREITMDSEIHSMMEEGFNNHILSVRVNSGCWVICQYSNYRGRQFLLEPIEITNWLKFSSLETIGSMFPIRQKRHFLRIKNKERGHFLSVQGGVEELKSGRVVVTPECEPMSDVWFYQDGFIKSKLSSVMSLQVMGNVEPGAKVVLWAETRQPIQNWTAKMRGLITNLTFPGFVLDVKGGKSYDKDHVVIMPEDDERPSQQWEIELL
ncbi:beta/gamma crystallin domain-containing protein 1 [Trematomus bernacchii]|uniref:beta/gamma crystallin domain-containing protein 1 n=1 Tax=Trematomus bernacchii TaxID=40690 RepID=UPI00146B205A|nr:beta/gamma crystallin domain-containing protein 1 [Trematomus bernacchii]